MQHSLNETHPFECGTSLKYAGIGTVSFRPNLECKREDFIDYLINFECQKLHTPFTRLQIRSFIDFEGAAASSRHEE
jgi:hypothetical protein